MTVELVTFNNMMGLKFLPILRDMIGGNNMAGIPSRYTIQYGGDPSRSGRDRGSRSLTET